MPSRELARLQRLKISNMTETRLRTEFTKSIKNLQTEVKEKDQAAKTLQDQLRTASQTLRKTDQTNKQLVTQNARQAAKLEKLEAQISSLRDTVAKQPLTLDITPSIRKRVTELQMENVQLAARLNAAEALAGKLQKENDAIKKSHATLETGEIFQRFSEDISTASKKIPPDFQLDDVEIDVRGALGAEGKKVVLGLDASQQSHPEATTRIKFNLRRRAQITIVDDEDE